MAAMNVLIIGAGKSGTYLAEKLRANHKVTMVEIRPERADYVRGRMPDVRLIRGDGCEPAVTSSDSLIPQVSATNLGV